MATVNINGTIRHIDYAEIYFVWDGGSDDYLVHHWVENTLSIEEGGYARHDVDYDGPNMVTRRRQGKPNVSMIKFDVKRSDLSGANDLHARMLAEADASDGYVPEFSWYAILYDNRGSANGEKVLFDNCIFEGGFSASHGQQHDTVPVSIIAHTPTATITDVPAA